METIENVVAIEIEHWLQRRLRTVNKELSDFRTLLADDLADALTHSKNALIATGKKSAIEEALGFSENAHESDEPAAWLVSMMKLARARLLRMARDVVYQDHAPVDLVKRAVLAQWAEIVETVQDEGFTS